MGEVKFKFLESTLNVSVQRDNYVQVYKRYEELAYELIQSFIVTYEPENETDAYENALAQGYAVLDKAIDNAVEWLQELGVEKLDKKSFCKNYYEEYNTWADDIKKIKVFEKLLESLKTNIRQLSYSVMNVLKNIKKWEFDYVTVEDRATAELLITTLKADNLESTIMTIFALDPFNIDLYAYIIENEIDKNGDIVEIAKYYGVYIDDIVNKKLLSYLEPALDTEDAATNAKLKIVNSMLCYNIETSIALKKINDILDKLLIAKTRTFNNYVYDTEENCLEAKMQYDSLVQLCEPCDTMSKSALKAMKKEISDKKYVGNIAEKFINQINDQIAKIEDLDQEAETVSELYVEIQEFYDSKISNILKKCLFCINDSNGEKFEQAKGRFSAMEDEEVVVYFSDSGWSSSRDGFIITDKKIYNRCAFADEWAIALDGIEHIVIDYKKILVNNQILACSTISKDELRNLVKFLNFVINTLTNDEFEDEETIDGEEKQESTKFEADDDGMEYMAKLAMSSFLQIEEDDDGMEYMAKSAMSGSPQIEEDDYGMEYMAKSAMSGSPQIEEDDYGMEYMAILAMSGSGQVDVEEGVWKAEAEYLDATSDEEDDDEYWDSVADEEDDEYLDATSDEEDDEYWDSVADEEDDEYLDATSDEEDDEYLDATADEEDDEYLDAVADEEDDEYLDAIADEEDDEYLDAVADEEDDEYLDAIADEEDDEYLDATADEEDDEYLDATADEEDDEYLDAAADEEDDEYLDAVADEEDDEYLDAVADEEDDEYLDATADEEDDEYLDATADEEDDEYLDATADEEDDEYLDATADEEDDEYLDATADEEDDEYLDATADEEDDEYLDATADEEDDEYLDATADEEDDEYLDAVADEEDGEYLDATADDNDDEDVWQAVANDEDIWEARRISDDDMPVVLKDLLQKNVNNKNNVVRLKTQLTDTDIERIQNCYSNMRCKSLHQRLYNITRLADYPKKMMNAKKQYAPFSDGEEVVILYDDTVFGTAKSGFVITNKNLYSKIVFQAAVTIPLIHISSVKKEKNNILVNNTVLPTGLMDIDDMNVLVDFLKFIASCVGEQVGYRTIKA
ncbi:hypothetical protein [Candidatus Epulonipiscium viviparus]|uniref:hypothetical protein n=1 Tax=Candidatus Epulonipiscium viviparus TaxID=420336 RepID=UPI00273804CD|nr:hypothetical protein [Candidatus Epulopiscium viviparus]